MSVVSRLHSAHYLTSSPDLARCPPDIGREVAFAGRSNAGKSSAINKITNQPKLAKTSKTPGRTQMINFFSLDEESNDTRLVDLPGYGYAKVPLAMKKKWQEAMSEYLAERDSLKGMVLLMDIRHPLKDFDTGMIEWADRNSMPVHVLLTKADKLKNGPAKATLMKVEKYLAELEHPASIQLFSAMKNQGIKEAQKLLGEWLEIPAG